MKKWILPAVISLCMTVALAGCGSAPAQTTAAPETTTAAAETTAAPEETTAAPEEAKAPFGNIPSGTFTYVERDPEGSGENGEIRFVYDAEEGEDNVFWALDSESGSFAAEGDTFNFFEELYISGRPLYDWLASNMRSTEGFEGNLSDQLLLSFEDGLLSGITVTDGTANVVALVTKDITAPDLILDGATRGQPNLLQSSITLMGSANCVEVTHQGNAVLDNLTLYGNDEGVGLKASKIGGDVFVVGTLYVDAEVHWYSRYGNIQAIKMDAEATLETNGQTIDLRGANIGRMRALNLKSNGGDIIIGTEVSNDYARGGLLEDLTKGTLSYSNTGYIDAGDGDVIIGTNTEKIVSLDIVGDITANNVTIKPTDNGTPSPVARSIGNITAKGDVDIVLGDVNAANGPSSVIGDITAGGKVSLVAGVVNGYIGSIEAGGEVNVSVKGCANADTLADSIKGSPVTTDIGTEFGSNMVEAAPYTGKILLNGEDTGMKGYLIDGALCIDIRDLLYKLDGTAKESYVSWTGATSGILTINTNQDYATSNLKNYEPLAAIGSEPASAFPAETNAIYVDSVQITLPVYSVDGKCIVFRVDDVATILGLNIDYSQDINFSIPE